MPSNNEFSETKNLNSNGDLGSEPSPKRQRLGIPSVTDQTSLQWVSHQCSVAPQLHTNDHSNSSGLSGVSSKQCDLAEADPWSLTTADVAEVDPWSLTTAEESASFWGGQNDHKCDTRTLEKPSDCKVTLPSDDDNQEGVLISNERQVHSSISCDTETDPVKETGNTSVLSYAGNILDRSDCARPETPNCDNKAGLRNDNFNQPDSIAGQTENFDDAAPNQFELDPESLVDDPDGDVFVTESSERANSEHRMWRPVVRKDPYPINEQLQLSLEEVS